MLIFTVNHNIRKNYINKLNVLIIKIWSRRKDGKIPVGPLTLAAEGNINDISVCDRSIKERRKKLTECATIKMIDN